MTDALCAVPRCGGAPHARGVCWRHWQRASWSMRRGASWRVALSEVGVPSARLDAIERGEAPAQNPQEEPVRDAETDAPTCETCGEEIPWGGRGRRPRWCVEHRAAGRAAAAKARLAAGRQSASEEPQEEAENEGEEEVAPEAGDGEATEDEAQAEAEEPEGDEAASPEGEAQADEPAGLPEAVELLRRALPRQARGAFVAGYLLGRGVL